MRIRAEEFLALDLEVHALLAGVPLHDVSAVDLPGGGPDRSVLELRRFFSAERPTREGGATSTLFALRGALGRLFGWDDASHDRPEESYVHRLGEELRARSALAPGSDDGPFRVLYALPREALAEIRNATVHAFSCMVLWPVEGGYRFYWAIYVKPVSRLTPLYMAAIEPFRRFVVYPTLLGNVRRAWLAGRLGGEA